MNCERERSKPQKTTVFSYEIRSGFPRSAGNQPVVSAPDTVSNPPRLRYDIDFKRRGAGSLLNSSTYRLSQEWFALVAVVFDMDGLLLNTEHLYDVVIGEMLRRRGQVFDLTSKRAMMGRPAADALSILRQTFGIDDSIDSLADQIESGLFERLPFELSTLPGVLALLDEVERLGLPMSVATSSRRSFAERALSEAGVLSRFRFLVCGAEVSRGKPAPDIYHVSAQRHQVASDQLLVFEDSVAGATAALAAGATTVAVPGEHNEPADYPGCHLVVARIDDPQVVRLVADWGLKLRSTS